MFDKSKILHRSTSASFIIFDFGSFKNEESYVIYIGYRIIHISEEDYEIWDKYYWSEDNTIREMIKQIILEKYGHGRNDTKRNEIKCF